MFELALIGAHGYFGLLMNQGPEFLEPRVEAGLNRISGRNIRMEAGMAGIVSGRIIGLEGRRGSKERI